MWKWGANVGREEIEEEIGGEGGGEREEIKEWGMKTERTISFWKPRTSVTMMKPHQCPWIQVWIQHLYSKSISLVLFIELGVCPLESTEPCGTQTTIITVYLADRKSLARHKNWQLHWEWKWADAQGIKPQSLNDLKSKQENRELCNPTCELHLSSNPQSISMMFFSWVLSCYFENEAQTLDSVLYRTT